MRRREKSIWMIILVGLIGLILGFFIGELFVYIAQNVEFLAFLRFVGYSASFGLDNIGLNLIFARFALGFTINISVMGVLMALVFLIIYFRR